MKPAALPAPAMLLRAAPVRLAIASTFLILFCFYLFGPSDLSLPYRNRKWLPLANDTRHGEGKQSQPASTDVLTEVKNVLQRPVAPLDLHGMGEHTIALTTLADAVQAGAEPESTLIARLKDHFPWWDPNLTPYLPWKASSAGRTKANGTGLVISMGTGNMHLGAHLISGLRNVLKSTIPIEISYAGEADLPYKSRAFLRNLGTDISFINLVDFFDDAEAGLQGGGYAQKPFAMLASRFERVILADADTIFLKKPEDIFETELPLSKLGVYFWHDRAIRNPDVTRREWVRGLLEGREPSAMLNQSLFWQHDVWFEMDSGLVCMDKGRTDVFMSLVFTAWMNSRKLRDEKVYSNVFGDKETYWIATELSSTPYHFDRDYAGIIGQITDYQDGSTTKKQVCGAQMVHMDSNRKPFWFNGSLRLDKHKPEVKYGTFDGWMTGGFKLEDQLSWSTEDGGNTWCAKSAEPQSLVGTGYHELLKELVKEAELVDYLLKP